MKKTAFFVLLAFTVLVAAQAQAGLPATYQEFKARYQTEGRTMEGAAHLYFEAVFCYMNKASRPEASKMLRYAMYLPMVLEESHSYSTFVSRLKDPTYHYIFRSFVVGTSPENSYKIDPNNFKLDIAYKRQESDFFHLGIRSSGADSTRSIWMQQHDDLWYVVNNAATYAQVRAPKDSLDSRRNRHDADYDQ